MLYMTWYGVVLFFLFFFSLGSLRACCSSEAPNSIILLKAHSIKMTANDLLLYPQASKSGKKFLLEIDDSLRIDS